MRDQSISSLLPQLGRGIRRSVVVPGSVIEAGFARLVLGRENVGMRGWQRIWVSDAIERLVSGCDTLLERTEM